MGIQIDEVMNRLGGIHSATEKDEKRKLLELASLHCHLGRLVEIGSAWGATAVLFAELAKEENLKPVVCIDLWEAYDDLGRPTTIGFSSFEKTLKEHNLFEYVKPIKNISSEVLKTWNEPIGFLFVDGNHAYEYVKADIIGYSKFVVPGGIIACHDYGYFEETRRGIEDAAKELGKAIEKSVRSLALIRF